MDATDLRSLIGVLQGAADLADLDEQAGLVRDAWIGMSIDKRQDVRLTAPDLYDRLGALSTFMFGRGL